MSKPIIKIPSSRIYSMENTKVIDNRIDRVEIPAVVPQIVVDTQNVYNGSVESGFIPDDLQKGEIAAKATQHGAGTNNVYYPTAVAYIEETPTYVTATFTIPRLSIQNSSILRILTGAGSNGQPNIKCSFRGNVSKGTSNGSAYIFNASPLGVDVRSLVVEAPTDVLTTPDTSYSLSTAVTDISYQSTFQSTLGGGTSSVTTTATFTLSNASTILSAEATPTDDGESFTITLKILCGIEINKLKGGLNFPNTPVNLRLKGEYEKYIPTEANVSFYGDTISLNLEDQTITIGDGSNSFQFQSSELLQTTNTPTMEELGQKVYDEWKNGKETAVIKCAIEDYYDINGNLVINPYDYIYDNAIKVRVTRKVSNNVYRIATQRAYPAGIGNAVYYRNESYPIVFTGGSTTFDIECNDDSLLAKLLGQTNWTTVNRNNAPIIKMSFALDDIVIPYVYGANGEDKPMSLYKDGTPKVFKVLGKRTIYDGAIWQTLSLQEYANSETTTAISTASIESISNSARPLSIQSDNKYNEYAESDTSAQPLQALNDTTTTDIENN